MKKGRRGEELAADYLARNGFQILERNWHAGRSGELDIVALDHDVLVFVEVKTATTDRFGDPVTWVDGTKQTQLARLAELFLVGRTFQFSAVRFDVVTVDAANNPPEIAHIRDAFRPGIS